MMSSWDVEGPARLSVGEGVGRGEEVMKAVVWTGEGHEFVPAMLGELTMMGSSRRGRRGYGGGDGRCSGSSIGFVRGGLSW
jgi:hypothetical protein